MLELILDFAFSVAFWEAGKYVYGKYKQYRKERKG